MKGWQRPEEASLKDQAKTAIGSLALGPPVPGWDCGEASARLSTLTVRSFRSSLKFERRSTSSLCKAASLSSRASKLIFQYWNRAYLHSKHILSSYASQCVSFPNLRSTKKWVTPDWKTWIPRNKINVLTLNKVCTAVIKSCLEILNISLPTKGRLSIYYSPEHLPYARHAQTTIDKKGNVLWYRIGSPTAQTSFVLHFGPCPDKLPLHLKTESLCCKERQPHQNMLRNLVHCETVMIVA